MSLMGGERTFRPDAPGAGSVETAHLYVSPRHRDRRPSEIIR
jgi:hypothetical protein